jgi:hypothetical protein
MFDAGEDACHRRTLVTGHWSLVTGHFRLSDSTGEKPPSKVRPGVAGLSLPLLEDFSRTSPQKNRIKQ